MPSALETPPSSAFLHEDGSTNETNLLKTPSHNDNQPPTLDDHRTESVARIATPLSECPRSTINATGSQVGAVFGNASGGGSGSLTYDDASSMDECRVKEPIESIEAAHGLGLEHQIEDPSFAFNEDTSDVVPSSRSPATHHLLASPRQTRAPPCTPSCNEINSFGWLTFDTPADDPDESTAAAEGRTFGHTYRKAKSGHTLWGMPRSDTFGTLSGVQTGSTADSALAEDDDDRQSSDGQDKENPRVGRRSQQKQKADQPAQQPRRPSFFSFHLSSSLLRAKTGLDNRRYSNDDGDADGSV